MPFLASYNELKNLDYERNRTTELEVEDVQIQKNPLIFSNERKQFSLGQLIHKKLLTLTLLASIFIVYFIFFNTKKPQQTKLKEINQQMQLMNQQQVQSAAYQMAQLNSLDEQAVQNLAMIIQPPNLLPLPRPSPSLSTYEAILGHISMDKPIYKPNDVAFIEVYLVNPLTKQTITDDDITAQLVILDSFNNEIHKSSVVKASNGTLVFTFKVPSDAKGGLYQAKVTQTSFNSVKFPTEFRKFRINQYTQPELFVTVDFEKSAYSSGDQVNAKIKVRRPDGEKLAHGSSVSFNLEIPSASIYEDSNQIQQNFLPLNQQGELNISFFIPLNTTQKQVSLSVSTYIGYTQGTPGAQPFVSSFSVPIVQSQSFKVEFFSEMGHNDGFGQPALVQDVLNKIYIQVYTEEGIKQPLQFEKATLISYNTSDQGLSAARQIITISKEDTHLGRASFVFVPLDGLVYTLQVQRTIEEEYKNFDVPKINPRLTLSCIMLKDEGVFDEGDEFIELQFMKNSAFKPYGKNITIQILNKDKLLKEYNVNQEIVNQKDSLNEQGKPYTFRIQTDQLYSSYQNGGVLTLRIYNNFKQLSQIAMQMIQLERIIILKPQNKNFLKFSIVSDKEEYQPGEKVDLKINIGDIAQNLVDPEEKFYVSVQVSDFSSFLEVQNYKQMPSLPAMIYLEKEIIQQNEEIDEFQYSGEYLEAWYKTNSHDFSSNSPKNTAIDLLLGVQAWRKGLLNNQNLENFESSIRSKKEGSIERLRLEYLLGRQPKIVYPIYRRGIMYKSVAFNRGPQPMAVQFNGPMADAAATSPMAESVIKVPQVPAIKAGVSKILDPLDFSSDAIKNFSQNDFMLNISENARTYSHMFSEIQSNLDVRSDFTQTLLFVSALSFSNEAEISLSFMLNDQVSQFQITANVFSNKGRYGVAKQILQSNKNFYSKFTLPVSITERDNYKIPVTVVNNAILSQNILARIQIIQHGDAQNIGSQQALQDIIQIDRNITLESKSEEIIFFDLVAIQNYSRAKVVVALYTTNNQDGGPYLADRVIQTTQILVEGFEQQKYQSGRIGVSADGSVQASIDWNFTLTDSMVGRPHFVAKVFAKPLDSVIDAISSLIRNPSGCFEQTSSTTYPMIMALSLLKELEKSLTDEDQIANVKKMEKEIIQKLKDGYKRLQSFETSSKGYEWFGTAPGHETLTAYGLAQFQDMKKIVNFVDQASIDRNTAWVLQRKSKDGSGQFMLNPRALDTFGRAAQNISDAYIVWVLTQDGAFGYADLAREFDNLCNISQQTNDPYFLSLYSGALFNIGNLTEAAKVSQRVIQSQNSTSGAVQGSKSSITNSQGQSLILETTSLAVINWLNQDIQLFSKSIDLGIGFLLSSIKDGGRFGTTQSTVLTLKALVRYSQIYQGIKGEGQFTLYMNNEIVQAIPFNEKDSKSLKKIDFTDELNKYYAEHPTSQNINIQLVVTNYTNSGDSGDLKLSYLLQMSYKDAYPLSSEGSLISFKMKESTSLSEMNTLGKSQIVTLDIENLSKKPQGMVVAIINIPSCLSVDMNQLEILKERNSIDNFEISTDKSAITLYWTYLKVDEIKNVQITRIAKYGYSICQDKVSQAYLYYMDEVKVWIKTGDYSKNILTKSQELSQQLILE